MCPHKEIRLQVALAEMGFASRRGAVELVKSGRVRVDGKTILSPGERVDLEKNSITVDGRKSALRKKAYYILNKPRGVVTTVKDRYARNTVLDIVKVKGLRIYPVGRLDKDTTGLLLLTNDGGLSYCLTHPKFGIKKVYQVAVKGDIPRDKIRSLEEGIILEGKRTYPCKIKVITREKETTKLEVELTEGRKRQIKLVFAKLGHPVLDIHRIAFGPLTLKGLRQGCWRALRTRELAALKGIIKTN